MKSNVGLTVNLEVTDPETVSAVSKSPLEAPKLRLIFTPEQLKILGFDKQDSEETNTDGKYEAI